MIGYGISGTTHDFFAYNAAGNVWNGSAFVAWNNANYASYRITATETGSTGRFTGTAPSGTSTYELRERGASLAESYIVWTGDFAATDAATAATNTALLGSGTAAIYSPVAGDGTLLELIIGDDYLTANDRALAWTFNEIPGITISATGRFGIQDAATGTEVYQNTSGVVTEPTTGTFKVSFDIPKAALASLPPGDYDWSVQVVEGSSCITVAKNRQRKTRVKLVEKYTTCS